MQRLLKYRHEAVLFEQDELRLPNGDYVSDASARLRAWWLDRGLNMEFEKTPLPTLLRVRLICCVEDVS